MKTVSNLFLLSLICVGAIFGGLYSGNILLGYGIAFAATAFVSWKYFTKAKKSSRRRMNEEAFTRHWRSVRNNQ